MTFWSPSSYGALTIWTEFPAEYFGQMELYYSSSRKWSDWAVLPRHILHFFSEMLQQGAWHQVIDKWYGNSRKFRLNREKSNSSEGITFFPKKFTGMNCIIWIHTGITGFSMQMVSAHGFLRSLFLVPRRFPPERGLRFLWRISRIWRPSFIGPESP